MSVASLEDMVLTQRTHPPEVVNYQGPYPEFTYTRHVHKFGQSQCVISERNCKRGRHQNMLLRERCISQRIGARCPSWACRLWNLVLAFHPVFIRFGDYRTTLIFKLEWRYKYYLINWAYHPSHLPTFIILGKLHNFSKCFFFSCATRMLCFIKLSNELMP